MLSESGPVEIEKCSNVLYVHVQVSMYIHVCCSIMHIMYLMYCILMYTYMYTYWHNIYTTLVYNHVRIYTVYDKHVCIYTVYVVFVVQIVVNTVIVIVK